MKVCLINKTLTDWLMPHWYEAEPLKYFPEQIYSDIRSVRADVRNKGKPVWIYELLSWCVYALLIAIFIVMNMIRLSLWFSYGWLWYKFTTMGV